MFFYEQADVSWLPPSCVHPWSDGVQPKARREARGGATAHARAVAAARALLAGVPPPSFWWTHTLGGGGRGLPVKKQEGQRVLEAAEEEAAAPPLATATAAAVLAPPRRRGGGPAGYHKITRNVWLPGVSRPKRRPKADIPTCDCVAPPPDAAAGADATAAADAPTHPPPPLETLSGRRACPTRAPGPPPPVGCPPDACINALSRVRCDARACAAGARCANAEFQLLPPPPIEPFVPHGDKGWGVRATAPLPEGTFVVEYVGEVTTDVECAARRAAAFAAGDPTVYYMALTLGLSIDARTRGNVARLINSSCAPNCVAQVWTDAATGEPRVGIFTSQDVRAGEELAYDYAFEAAPDGDDGDPGGAYACRCGAPTCRGTLRVAAPAEGGTVGRDRGRRLALVVGGDAEDGYRTSGVIVGYDQRKRAHAIATDDGRRLALDLRRVAHEWEDGGDDAGPPRRTRGRPRGDGDRAPRSATRGTPGSRVRSPATRARENAARRAKRAAAKGGGAMVSFESEGGATRTHTQAR